MDHRQEYLRARYELQRSMHNAGKKPAEIRKALSEFDRKERERKAAHLTKDET